MQASLLVALGLALFLAYGLWRRSQALRGEAGLPKGIVVYSDMEDWGPGNVLRSSRYGLVGKPDYLIKQGRRLTPVEVKPQRRAEEPYESDILQLAAYCLLVEEHTGLRPRYGLLRYRETTFRIPYSRRLERGLLRILDEMRAGACGTDAPRTHDDPTRCQFCGLRPHCSDRL